MADQDGASADTQYYLRFTDANGDVYTKDGGSLYAVTNVQFGVSMPTSIRTDGSTETGKPSFSDLTFTLGSSALTQALAQTEAAGTFWKKVELLGYNGSTLAVDDTFAMAAVDHDVTSMSADDQSLIHSVSLQYGALQEKVVSQGNAGTITGGWNQIQNTPYDTTVSTFAVNKTAATTAAAATATTDSPAQIQGVVTAAGTSSPAYEILVQFRTAGGTLIGTTDASKGWIEVDSASFSQTQSLSLSAQGSGAGAIAFDPLTLSFKAGTLEPTLFKDLASGSTLDVEVAVYGPPASSTDQPNIVDDYRFGGATVASMTSANSDGDQTYSLQYGLEGFEAYPAGSTKSANYGWDAATNTPAGPSSGLPKQSAPVNDAKIVPSSNDGTTADTQYYLEFTGPNGHVFNQDGGALYAVTGVTFGASNGGKLSFSNLSFTLGSSALTETLDQMEAAGTAWKQVELLGYNGSTLAVDDTFAVAAVTSDATSIDASAQRTVHNVSLQYQALHEAMNTSTGTIGDGSTVIPDVATDAGTASFADRIEVQFRAADGSVIKAATSSGDWIEVSTASFGQDQALSSGFQTGGAGAGKLSLDPLSLTFRAGALDPTLFKDLVSGTPLEVEVAVYTSHESATGSDIVDDYRFGSASIATMTSPDADGEDAYTFQYRSEVFKHYTPGSNNYTSYSWNSATQTAISDPSTVTGLPTQNAGLSASKTITTGYTGGATPDTTYYLKFMNAAGTYTKDGGSLYAVTNVQFGTSITQSLGAGGGTGKVSFSGLSFSLGSSALTQTLAQMAAEGATWKQVELLGYNGTTLAVDDRFSSAEVQSDTTAISGGDQSLVHNVSLQYAALQENVVSVGRGTTGSTVGAGWNQIQNISDDPTQTLAASSLGVTSTKAAFAVAAATSDTGQIPNLVTSAGTTTNFDKVQVQFRATDGRVVGATTDSKGWIDVSSAAFSEDQQLGIAAASAGTGAGELVFDPLKLTMSAGALEPTLFKDLVSGTPLQVEVAVSAASSSAKSGFAPVDDYRFIGATISDMSSADSDGNQTYTIQYTAASSQHYTPGSTKATNSGWNTITNLADDSTGFTGDGYIAGATVFADANGNGQLDPGEAFTTTDPYGNFTLIGGTGPLVATGGTDITTGLAFTGTLLAPAGAAAITPLTTAVQVVAATTGVSAAQANASVVASLGLTNGTDLTSLDAEAGATTGDPTATATFAAQVQAANAFALITAAGGDLTSSAAQTAIAAVFTAPTNGLGDAATLSGLATAAGLGDAAAATVGDIASHANTLITQAATSGGTAQDIMSTIAAVATVAQGAAATAVGQAGDDPTQLAAATTSYTGPNLTTATSAAGGTLPLQPDPGPTAATGTFVASPGQTQIVTALINSLVTPGLPGDTETITSLAADIGQASVGPDGALIYTAPSSGTDTLTYTVSDQLGDLATGSVDVTVDSGPVITRTASTKVGHGQSAVVATVTPGAPGATLTFFGNTTSGGALSLVGNQVLYTAPTTINGAVHDSLSYEVVDQFGERASANAIVSVDPGPTITAFTVPVVWVGGQSTVLARVAPGLPSDSLQLTGTTTQGGTLSLANSQVIYTAPTTISGTAPDVVNYTVTDQLGDSVGATANLVVDTGAKILPATPAVVEKGQTTVIGTVTPGFVGDPIVLNQEAGSAGTLKLGTLQPDGTQQIIYTAPTSTSASALDNVAYFISDPFVPAVELGSAMVQLDAGAMIAPASPAVVEAGQSTVIGTAIPGLPGDTLTLTQAPGALGTLSLGAVQANGTQQVVYTAPASFAARTLDNVSYTIADQHGDAIASAATTVTLDVPPAAPSLVLADDTGTSQSDRITNDPTITYTPAAIGDTLLYEADGATTYTTAQPSFATDGSADGTHIVSVDERDVDNSVGPAATLRFTLDTTPPAVAASAQNTEATSAAGAAVTFNATSSDQIDGTSDPITYTEQLSGGGTKVVQSGDTFAIGTHTIIASATDVAGNTGFSAPFTVMVRDTIPPTLTVAESVSGLTRQTSDTITGTVSDADGIASVHVFDGQTDLGAATLSNGSYHLTASGLSDGTHNFSVTALDNAGNRTTTSAGSVAVDTSTTAPVITSGQGNVQHRDRTISGTAEANATITLVDHNNRTGKVSILGQVIADASGHWSDRIAFASHGAQAVEAIATDAADNNATSETKTYRFPPASYNLFVQVMAWTNPAGGGFFAPTFGVQTQQNPTLAAPHGAH